MQASRDQNNVPTLLAVSASDGTTPTTVYADPTTHRLLVETTDGGVVGPGASTDNAVVVWDGTTGELVKNSTVTIVSGVVNATGYKAGGTAPVADGTYTLGLGTPITGHNGTITIKGGIITAVQQCD